MAKPREVCYHSVFSMATYRGRRPLRTRPWGSKDDCLLKPCNFHWGDKARLVPILHYAISKRKMVFLQPYISPGKIKAGFASTIHFHMAKQNAFRFRCAFARAAKGGLIRPCMLNKGEVGATLIFPMWMQSMVCFNPACSHQKAKTGLLPLGIFPLGSKCGSLAP